MVRTHDCVPRRTWLCGSRPGLRKQPRAALRESGLCGELSRAEFQRRHGDGMNYPPKIAVAALVNSLKGLSSGSSGTIGVDLEVGVSNLYDLVCLRTASETTAASAHDASLRSRASVMVTSYPYAVFRRLPGALTSIQAAVPFQNRSKPACLKCSCCFLGLAAIASIVMSASPISTVST